MAPREDEPVNRQHIKEDLIEHARRLAQHAPHLSAKERDQLDGIVDTLAELHTDDDACARLCRRHSQPPPPWGTRYAPLWERLWHAFRSGLSNR